MVCYHRRKLISSEQYSGCSLLRSSFKKVILHPWNKQSPLYSSKSKRKDLAPPESTANTIQGYRGLNLVHLAGSINSVILV